MARRDGFWVMPRIASRSTKDGKLGMQHGVVRADRGNRFNVQFDLGSIACCAADAERIVQDAMRILVARVKANWSRGRSAGGEPLDPPKKRYKRRKIPGIPRTMTFPEAARLENKVIDGQMTYQKETEKNRDRIVRLKEWAKTVKRNYQWNGQLYRPPKTIGEEKVVGYWSGLLVASLAASTVRIKSRAGKVPKRVQCRITISPKRAGAMKSMRMWDMGPNDEAWREIGIFLSEAVLQTTAFKSWQDKRDWSQSELRTLYRNFLRKHGNSRRILTMLNKAFQQGWAVV